MFQETLQKIPTEGKITVKNVIEPINPHLKNVKKTENKNLH